MPQTRKLIGMDAIHFRGSDEGPEVLQHTYERCVESDEQIYERHTSVGEDWKRLDYGWVEDPSTVFIVNKSKEVTLELGFAQDQLDAGDVGPGVIYIFPGESQKISYSRPDLLSIRSQQGQVKFRLCAIPK